MATKWCSRMAAGNSWIWCCTPRDTNGARRTRVNTSNGRAGGRRCICRFSRLHHNLFGIGYIETNSSAFKLFDAQAHLIASYLREQSAGAERVRAFDALIAHDDPDLSGGIKFIKSQRHTVYLEVHAFKRYLQRLRRQFGWGDLADGYYAGLRSTSSGAAPSALQQPQQAV